MIRSGYRYFRWLSLDIVLGANVFLAFLGEIYQLSFSWHVYLALSCAVWLIYTVDHLVDAKAVANLSPRRMFHLQYFDQLVIASSCVLVIGLINTLYLPVPLIRAGALLAAGCVVYLLTVYLNRSLWVKEVLVSVGYGLGIFLAPLVFSGHWNGHDLYLLGQLILIALINLLIFSLYERKEDEDSGFGSLVVHLGDRSITTIGILLGVSFLSVLASVIMLPEDYLPIQLIYLLMTAVLSLLIIFRSFFKHAERFRDLGDSIFYLPVLFLV